MTRNIYEIVNKKGKSYKVQIRHKGYKPVYKTFYDKNPKEAKKQAQLWADDIELQMRKGTYKDSNVGICDVDSLNFQHVYELIDYFEINIAPKRYSYSDKYSVMYSWWKDKIGTLNLKELTPQILSSCKQLLINEKISRGKNKTITRGNNTVNKYLMCLSAVLTYAVKELELLEINPMSKVALMKKPDGRTRRLQKDEMQKFVSAVKNHSDSALLFFLLLLYTGGRYSEVLQLKVETIDFKNGRVSFLNTKNKTNRSVGIGTDLLEMINQFITKHNITSGYIFYNYKNNNFLYMRGILNTIIKNVGLKDFHIHDIRHTFASIAAEEGASLLDIATLLGHKSLVMARRYSHLTQQHTDNIARNTAKSMQLDNLIK